MLTLGYPCVAIPGVWNVAKYASKGDKSSPILPIKELKPFLQPGRKITFIYDSDEKLKTQKTVYKALKRAGQKFIEAGCNVGWITWDSAEGKGVDDLFANLVKQHGEAIAETELIKRLETKASGHFAFGYHTLKSYEEELYRVVQEPEEHVLRHLFGNGYGDWITSNSNYYKYTGKGYWEKQDEVSVLQQIRNFLAKCYYEKAGKKDEDPIKSYTVCSHAAVTATFKHCLYSLDKSAAVRWGRKRYLCFTNKTLDLTTRQQLEHSRNHYITAQIDGPYTLTATCHPSSKTSSQEL